MKQILQNLRNGVTEVAETPTPSNGAGELLIRTRRSLISAGTERMLVEFGKASLLGKARSQPEKVKQVLEKIRTDGLLPTLEAVFSRLDEPLPLGYCNAGVVEEVGSAATGFSKGDRVASNGPHAEFVAAPQLLCAKIPDGVTDEQAAFTVLSSIGLQGIRLIRPELGETVVVYGLGLIGLIAVQMLRSAGCRVIGIDINEMRLALAEKFGARAIDGAAGNGPLAAVGALTEARGADAVLITAAAKGDEIVHQSAELCRKRGRIVLVGDVNLQLRRSDFYEKELSFQVSCSYGPGRYDANYEERGRDYPLGFVRWTEQRNMQAVLEMLASGRLIVDDLITHRYELDEAAAAYQSIQQDPTALGVVLKYRYDAERAISVLVRPREAKADQPVIGVIGAGLFVKATLLPALSKTGARLAYIANRKGSGARRLADKFRIETVTTDYRTVLTDERVRAVMIAVGHHLHADFVCESLAAGKHTFVEKPLALDVEQLKRVMAAADAAADCLLMVGFNRRYSPHAVKMKELLRGGGEPLAMNYTVNAGFIPPDHWTQQPEGGGRIIGEACHFIDLMVFLTGSKVASVAAHQVGRGVAVKEDKMSISLGFADGSVGTVNYFANGSKAYPKESLEVFHEQRTLQLDNFRITKGYGFKGFSKFKTFQQDKGHRAEMAAFVTQVKEGGPPLIAMEEMVNVTLASFAAMTAATEGRTVNVDEELDKALAAQR